MFVARVALLILFLSAPAGAEAKVGAAPESRYVGSQRCQACHPEQLGAWQDSLHAWAMKPAAEPDALALFDGKTRTLDPHTAITPSRRDGAPWLKLPGESPDAEDFELGYFFGRGSLEQYLVAKEGGRWQALPVGYDVRKEEWFHLFPGENRLPEEWGHWTNRGMNANSECLYCHTTDYRKGYDAKTDAYETTWGEAGVGCEGCHGAGSGHVAARSAPAGEGGGRGDPYRATRADLRSIDLCAPCHSRRGEIRESLESGHDFLDTFAPALLDRDSFHPNGEIGRDEVFEWTSFRMSRMHSLGVTCTNCHDPHTATLRAEGNALCMGCHVPGLDDPAHTHHPRGGPGSKCVECHMPEQLYMQRDPRRDHSMPIPDPALSSELGAPNACAGCHKAKTGQWAAERVDEWFAAAGPATRTARERRREAARAIAGGRVGVPEAAAGLVKLLDGSGDAIRRASAARLLASYVADPAVRERLLAHTADPDPLVRSAVVFALSEARGSSPEVNAALFRAAEDPVRIVRNEAAFGLREWRPEGQAEAASVTRALEEWEAATRSTLERPVSLHNLGNFLIARGRYDEAVAAYRRAARFEPGAVAPRHNLAMFLAGQGRLEEAESEFRGILEQQPEASAASAFSLGLLYGQQGRWREAVGAFEQCVAQEPDYPRAYYNLGLAQSKLGDTGAALQSLERAASVPGSRASAAQVLTSIYGQLGKRQEAEDWAKRAAERGGVE